MRSMIDNLFEQAPIWTVFAFVVALVMVSTFGGYQLGADQKKRGKGHSDGPSGAVLGSTLGLLAFVLAITFGGASSRFEARKQLMLEDVNTIATAARRADLLPQPQRDQSRAMLRRYVELRTEMLSDYRTIPRAMAASESLQDRMWEHGLALARSAPGADVGAYLTALNQVMNVHTSRKTVALVYRIPAVIWTGLLVLIFCAMVAVGYLFGVAGRANWVVSLVLASAFGAVITIIAVLDRPAQGGITVSPLPMLELQRRLGGPPPGASGTP